METSISKSGETPPRVNNISCFERTPPPPNICEVTMSTQLGEGINYVHEREEITVFVLPASGFLMAVRDFVSGNYE